MPERAKVFVAEDNSFSLFLAKQSLADDHHTVVLEAQTLAKALKCIAQFKEQNIQVAVLDGNLTENDSSGYDGKRMVKEIRELTPNVKIIGISSSFVPGADINLGKDNLPKLGQTINEL